ncbi:MAG: 1-deoxy-D-xylulose-5-phosphate reductoisomerase [Phycisphaerales bacterium]|nr:1-deoxy-D-xylulose-5-phosphate reductoisomerase [Phycisphaerales bacterium]PHX78180.1 MAG: 1-deoxy-D-xylulose-5-phosphate reductoisomerase [Planctomycetaceae bacterium]
MTETRRLIILGSTGSIGTATLEVVAHLAQQDDAPRYTVVGLAAGSNASLLAQQAEQFGVHDVALADTSSSSALPASLRIITGPDAALELIDRVAQPGDMVMASMVGVAGLAPVLAAIERGCDIALANKETLVAAGSVVQEAVARKGVKLLPVDSEHSAVFQCLRSGTLREVDRLVLTASGGPFRTWSPERTANATLAEALRHPTWQMGRKVTIDSASLMNKGLEVIEAHWLFDLSSDRIDAIVHPQSIVHSFVEFRDGSTIAQLSPPSMKHPIQYALTWPARLPGCCPTIAWDALRALEFEPVDHTRFPAINLAKRVIDAGGSSGAIFNAANEVAVEAFIAGSLRFGDIAAVVTDSLDRLPARAVHTLAEVLTADYEARECARTCVAERAAHSATVTR